MIYLDQTLYEFFKERPCLKKRVEDYCLKNGFDYNKIKPIATKHSIGVLINPPCEGIFIGSPRSKEMKKHFGLA